MSNILEFFSGRKTYTVSLMLLMKALWPGLSILISGGGIAAAAGAVDWNGVLDALGLSALRAGVAKQSPQQ